ncbi:hypothetical protein ACFQX6_61475 [Streptosporangium lutulentum]
MTIAFCERAPDGCSNWPGTMLGSQLAPGVSCSTRRALTLTAHDGATSAAFNAVLQTLARDVFTMTGIRLHPEPARPVAVLIAERDMP